jgi:hypothetical protein
MPETHDIRIVVDASQGKRELASFDTALGKVSKTLGGLNVRSGGGFERLGQQLGQLSGGFAKLKAVSNLGSLGKELSALSAGMNSLRAPSSSTISNLNGLSKALGNFKGVSVNKNIGAELSALGNGLGAIKVPNIEAIRRIPALIKELNKAGGLKVGTTVAADLKLLGDAFKSFRAPSDASIKRIPELLNVLKGVNINKNIAPALAALGAASGSIRAPSATAITNLGKLIATLGTGNVGQVTAMAHALSRLNGMNLNVGGGGRRPPAASGGGTTQKAGMFDSVSSALKNMTSHSRSASGEMRGLENAFSASYQAASMFRTAIGAITLGELASSVLEAGNNLLTFRIALDSVATSNTEVGEHFGFVKKLAEETGGSLAEMIPAYSRLAGAMRSLGKSSQDTQDTFGGFQKAMSAMHINPGEQAKTMRELMETFAMGGGHATQIMRGMASHIPSLTGVIQDTLHINGAQLRKKFEDGGIKPEEMVQIGKALGEKYAAGVEEGLNHSQAAINKFKNQLTLFQQSVFENGFDSGLRSMLSSITDTMKGLGVEDIGKKVGEGFRQAFIYVGAFAKLLIELRGPLLNIITMAAGIALLGTAFSIAGSGIGFLLSPIGKLSIGIMLLISQWDLLKSTLSGNNEGFNIGAAYIKGVAESIWNGDTSQSPLAAGEKAARAYYEGTKKSDPKSAGAEYAKKFSEGSSFLGDLFKTIMPEADFGKFGVAMKEFQDTVKKLQADSDPHGSTSLSDKFKNAADEARKLHDTLVTMTGDEEKLFQKIFPAVKATKELGDNLKTIDAMLGKRHPGEDNDKNLIKQSEIDKLKEVAKYNAMDTSAPATAKIRDMMETLKIDAHLGSKSGYKNHWEEEKKILEIRNELKKKGLDLDIQDESAIRKLIKAQQEVAKGGSNGFTQWANSVKSGTEVMNNNIKSSMDALSTGMSNLAVNGKGQFKNLGTAIRAELSGILKSMSQKFIKAGLDQMMSGLIKGIAGDKPNAKVTDALSAGQSALDRQNKKIEDSLAESSKVVNTMAVQASVVNISGMGSLGTPAGGTSFGLNGVNGATAPTFSSRPNSFSASEMSPYYAGQKMSIGEGGMSAFGPGGSMVSGAPRMWGGTDNKGIVGGGLAAFQSIPGYGIDLPKVVTSTGFGNIGGGGASTFSSEAFSYNASSMADLIKKHGGSDQEAQTLAAIGMAESRGRPDAHNTNRETGDNSYGLWQVNMLDKMGPERHKKYGLTSNDDLLNPDTNARVALKMSRDSKGYGDWATYNDGKYKKFLQPGASSPGVDMTPTNSITKADPKLESSMDKLSQSMTTKGTGINGLTSSTSAMTVNASSVNVNGGGAGAGGLTGTTGLNSTGAGGLTGTTGLNSTGTGDAGAAAAPAADAAGGGGMFGGLSSMFSGGAGGMGSMIMPMLGMGMTLAGLLLKRKHKPELNPMWRQQVAAMSEGGITGSAVSHVSAPASMWHGAPHYAEGTPNTSGGIPTMLHENEAVIPLSRGRAVPVQLNGGGAGGEGGNTTINKLSVNLQAKDHDSFRKNSAQVGADMSRAMGRVGMRNG